MKIEDLKSELVLLQSFMYFDENEFLREKCSNEDFLQKVIREVEGAIVEHITNLSESEELIFLYGTIGNLYRIKGEAKSAIATLSKAVELSEGNTKIVNLIRLGEALKYAEQHQQALDKFNNAIDQCVIQEHSLLLDFAYQHKGKCLLEIGDMSQASEYFQIALELRIKKGDVSLINSTQMALNLLEDTGEMK